jgi:hypothetical protein
MLAGEREAFIREHVMIDADGKLVRRNAKFGGLKPIAAARFLVAGRQLETAAVKMFLATGRWPRRPNKRNGDRNGGRRNGALSPAERRGADARLMALMRKRPNAGVRQLAGEIGMTHSCVSRRLTRLKTLGAVDHDGGGWTVEAPAQPNQPWIRGIDAFMRRDTSDGAPARFG